MLLSGSDIGWDLSSPEHGADPDFYSQYLKTVYAGNDASTYEFAGVGSDILNGLSGSFDDSTHGYYDVDSPDRLVPIDGSRVVLNYNGGSSDGAALAFGGHFRLVYYGFPLETVVDAEIRNGLICNSAEYLLETNNDVLYLPMVISGSQQ